MVATWTRQTLAQVDGDLRITRDLDEPLQLGVVCRRHLLQLHPIEPDATAAVHASIHRDVGDLDRREIPEIPLAGGAVE